MAFGDADKWSAHLDSLRMECFSDSKVYRECIEALMSHYRKTRDNDKYKRLNVEAFVKKYSKPAMKDFMLDAGWSVSGSHMVFHADESYYKQVMTRLSEERLPPNPNEWDPKNKVENVNYDGWNDAAEQMKRAAAAIQRVKEQQAYQRDKQERDECAKKIMQNIKSDQEYRRKMAAHHHISGRNDKRSH